MENVLSHIDYTMQYGEDEEPKEVGASPVCTCCPATLVRFHGKKQAWIALLFFHGTRCVKLILCLLFYSLPSHDRILDDATYAYAVADAHLDVPLLSLRSPAASLLLNARLTMGGGPL
jgi:hypothetical protein